MQLLVLGGTVFLSRQVAVEALARGHDVVCAARGLGGRPPAGAQLVRWDRAEPVPDELRRLEVDAVVDVSSTPSHVREAVAAFGDRHWVFVSTVSVYADMATVGASAADSPLLPEVTSDEDRYSSPQVYGGMKVACERIVRAGTGSSFVVRPGLIVGPGDPTGRFAYWPRAFRDAAWDGGPVLVPGAPDDPVQFVDVRDLAQWIVTLAEARTEGCLDAIRPPMSRAEFVAGLAAGSGTAPATVYVPDDGLLARGVAPWAGPGSIPLWLGSRDDAGMMTRDVTASVDAGLRSRAFRDTVRDTVEWLEATPDAAVAGLTRAEQLDLLAAVRSS